MLVLFAFLRISQNDTDARVQQAAYELFSPLSIDHSELNDRITEYIYKNWVSEPSFCQLDL